LEHLEKEELGARK